MSIVDQRTQYTEDVVGAGHPTLADVDNRHVLIQHDQYGAHKAVGWVLTNRAGVSLAAGDVVIADSANDSAVTTTTTVGSTKSVAVMVKGPNNEGDPCASNDPGMFASLGVTTVNVQGNVARGAFLRTSATAKRAESAGTSDTPGVFAVALTGYAGGGAGTVTALLLGHTSTGGAFQAGAAGARLFFDNDAAPTGWTRDTTTVNDRMLRVVTGTRADGGSWTLSGLTMPHTHGLGNHTHSTPNHGHNLTILPNASGSGTDHAISLSGSQLVASPTGNNNNGVLYTTDSGGAGTSGGPSTNTSDGASTSAVSSDASWRPLHRDVILCYPTN